MILKSWFTLIVTASFGWAIGAAAGQETVAPAAVPATPGVLWPQPRQLTPAPPMVLRLPVRIQAPAELSAPRVLLFQHTVELFGPEAATRGGTVVRLSLEPAALPRPEEYSVEAAAGEIHLRAHDTQGAFWAVHTLNALMEQARRVPGGWEVNIPHIDDWPDNSFRAFMFQGAWTTNLEDDRRMLALLARFHITYFALEFGPQVVLDFDPTIAERGRFTKAQAKAVVDYGRSLGLKPIGYLNMLGHLDRAYQRAPYTQHGGIDIRSDEAYDKFVYPILTEMLEVYGPVEYFHCGMDEAWELFTWLSGQGADVTTLLARHIERIDNFLKARGVKMVIWQDMFVTPELEKQLGAPVGPANGGAPQNTAAALAKIPKDVILDYWFYDPEPAYPALDYFQKQGFTVWASPWETPFSFVRYAQAHGASTMGTLWDGPPGGFSSPSSSPVAALYAQATWNAAAAPPDVQPEPKTRPDAQRATSAFLWRRRSLTFPTLQALLLSPTGPERQAVAGAPQQFYGVPFAIDRPLTIDPLPDASQPLTQPANATTIRLPGGETLALDGVNTNRGEDQLILYAAPRASTGTNIYGVEVSVSADGTVLQVNGYGPGDHPVPPGGFVLSAHEGPRSTKANALQRLRPGSRVAVLGAQGEWLGGYAPTRLLVNLPGDHVLRPDGENTAREADKLVIYTPGYNGGHTGTNEFGIEVVIQGGKVQTVRPNAGDSPIPADGYVLSAHRGATGIAADALQALHPGDPVRLIVEKGDKRYELDAALAERTRVLAVGAKCAAFYLGMSTKYTGAPGSILGEWQIRYADGTVEKIPCRLGREALAAGPDSLPQSMDDPVWMIEQAPLRCLVREWPNPHPDQPIREIAFVPAPAVLETGAQIIATAASS